jgi:hypothetical protein
MRQARHLSEIKWLCLPLAFMLVSFSAYSSTLKIEATLSSETPVNYHLTSQKMEVFKMCDVC